MYLPLISVPFLSFANQVWAVSSGRLVLCLRGHEGVITDMDVSPDNSLLVTSSEDRTVRVWDPRTGATLAVLRGHTAAVNLVRFAPGDSVAMSASEDGTCRVWDLRDQDRCVCAEFRHGRTGRGGRRVRCCLFTSPEVWEGGTYVRSSDCCGFGCKGVL